MNVALRIERAASSADALKQWPDRRAKRRTHDKGLESQLNPAPASAIVLRPPRKYSRRAQRFRSPGDRFRLGQRGGQHAGVSARASSPLAEENRIHELHQPRNRPVPRNREFPWRKAARNKSASAYFLYEICRLRL